MLYAIVAVIGIICDQLIKYWTVSHIALGSGDQTFIPHILNLTYIQNTGAAFSFLANSAASRILFVLLCFIVCAALIVLMAKNVIYGKGARWCAVLVMSGALGNAIDRILSGYVVDMFDFAFFTFPVFNFADILITLGGIAFCICVIVEKEKPSEPKAPKKERAHAVIREVGSKEESAPEAAPAAEETAAPEDKAEAVKQPSHAKSAPAAAKKAAPAKPASKAKRSSTPYHEPIEKKPGTVYPSNGIDPSDPFAEWERRMGVERAPATPKQETAAPAEARTSAAASVSQETKIFHTVSSSPKAAAAVHTDEDDVPAAEPAAEPKAAVPAEKPAEEKEEISAADESGDEFDLDSILAEFGSGDK